LRAARIGAGHRDPGELIQEPSRGGVLSAFSAAASASVGDLRLTLLGLVQKSRVTGWAKIGPVIEWLAAELFTSSGGAIFVDRFLRW